MSLQRIVKKLTLLAAPAIALALSTAFAHADGVAPPVAVGVPAASATAGPCVTPGGCGTACGTTGCCSQDGCCAKGCCPPPLVHCTPKPPKIKFKSVCGKPICNPCELEGYGYNPTCWRPWLPPLHCPNSPVPSLNCSVTALAGSPTPVNQTPAPTQDDDMLPLPQNLPADK